MTAAHAAPMISTRLKKSGAVLAVFAVLSSLFLVLAPESRALAPWGQTNWSGGVAAGTITSDVNTYLSQSNAVTSTPNQITIAGDGTWASGLSAWVRRVPISLNNPGALATDLQVEIVIPFQTGMKSDFSDLRFTNGAGASLPYWLQSKTDGVTSRLWVRVDSLAASASTTVFAYYGNAAASSTSDGAATFNFFDDFAGTSINLTKWTVTGTGANTFTQNGQLNVASSQCGPWGNRAIRSNDIFVRTGTNGWVLDSDLTTSGFLPACHPRKAQMVGWKDAAYGNDSYQSLVYGLYNTTAEPAVYQKGSALAGTAPANIPDSTTLISVAAKPSAGARYRWSSTGGATFTEVLDNTTHTDANLRILFTNYHTNSVWDNVRVRKYHTHSPVATIGAASNYFQSAGSLTSNIFDASIGVDIDNVTFATSVPVGTTVAVRLRSGNLPDLSDASAFGTCADLVGGADGTSACVPDNRRYVQYQVVMSSTGVVTPALTSISIGMSISDVTAPITNASAIEIRRTSVDAPLASDGWSNLSPYVSWTAGADNVGGSGLRGYCVYVGTDGSADPATTKGQLGTSPIALPAVCPYLTAATTLDLAASSVLGAPLASSNSSVYVRVKAVDLAGNIFSGAAASQRFRFDNTPPTNPSYLSAPSAFVADKAITINWPSTGAGSPADSHSGFIGMQYRIGPSGTWYGDTHSGTQDATDLLFNDGAYQMQASPDFPNLVDGTNVVYFRSFDAAGNLSASEVSTALKINTVSPLPPQNLSATPTTSTSNAFAFDWDPPAGFGGAESALTYCYTINALPTVTNCTFTAPGVTQVAQGAFATQPGDNTFYVVAKDEAGNINYSTAASVTFTANTPAPGMPLNLDVADISLKATSNWRLAVSWEPPPSMGSGVDEYDVQRSTNGSTYTSVARVSGLSFVDGGLDPLKYYYRIRACDSANNCGAFSGVAQNTPTGKFTTPAELVTAPTVSASTRTATIKWATDRQSDSRIAFGTASGLYASTEAADSEQVRNHEIQLDNLSAGITYYFRARWTDTDGNIGVSSEYTFTTLPAPVLTDIKANNIDVSTATINFTVRDASKISLVYGKSEGFGGLVTLNTSLVESSYSLNLVGLEDGVTYFYKIKTVDFDGYEYDPIVVFQFATPPRPRIAELRFQPVEGEPTSTQLVVWTTNVPTTSNVSYGPTGGARKESGDPVLKTEHEILVENLLDDTQYTLIAQSRDAGGNLATSDEQVFRTALDTRPPKITDFLVETAVSGSGNSARGQLIVSWTTDEPTTSQIAYGEGTGSDLSNRSPLDGSYTTEHVVVVSDVATAALYSVKAVSADRAGNVTESDSAVGIVNKASENAINIVLDVLNQVFGGG